MIQRQILFALCCYHSIAHSFFAKILFETLPIFENVYLGDKTWYQDVVVTLVIKPERR